MSSGPVFHIKHPDNVIVVKDTLVVMEPETDTVQWTSLIHMVAVRRHERPARGRKTAENKIGRE